MFLYKLLNFSCRFSVTFDCKRQFKENKRKDFIKLMMFIEQNKTKILIVFFFLLKTLNGKILRCLSGVHICCLICLK